MKKKQHLSEDTQMTMEKGRQTVSLSQSDPILVFAQRYQAFLNSTNDAIAVINPDREILDANPQLLKLSGYSYDTIVSKSFNELFDEKSLGWPSEEISDRMSTHIPYRKAPLGRDEFEFIEEPIWLPQNDSGCHP